MRMKIALHSLLLHLLLLSTYARSDAIVVTVNGEDVRVTALSERLVRLEPRGPKGFEDGTTFNVLNRGAELATYSSLVLQWSVLLLIALTFIYIMQRQNEERPNNVIHDNVLESE